MDVLTIIGVFGIVIGIIAGIVQIVDYLQKRRQKPVESMLVGSRVIRASVREPTLDWMVRLRHNLTRFFSESELQSLCFDLGVDYKNLSGNNKEDKARELVEYMQRHGRLPELVEKGEYLRPQANWFRANAELPEIFSANKPDILHNLPRHQDFVGRTAEKTRVHEALLSDAYLISIDGIGGIGKSSLAREIALECLEASQNIRSEQRIATFDGFVWATAKDRELTLNSLLDIVARTLEYPGYIQQPLEEKKRSIRQLLRRERCLLIVDNYDTVTDESVGTFLSDIPEPSKVLITTRVQNLSQAYAVSLKGLTDHEALSLIRREAQRLGLRSVEQAGDDVLKPLEKAAGGAPLAIKWALGQMKQRGQSLDIVLGALQNAKSDIFEEMFSRSWDLLSAAAQHILLVMPLFASAPTQESIRTVSGVSELEIDEALGQAVEMWLIEATDGFERDKRRFSIHPLTRSFATVRLANTGEYEQQAKRRFINYYTARCSQLGYWANTEDFPWLESELPNILTAILWAETTQDWKAIFAIFHHVFYFLGTRGYWQDRLHYGQIAIRAAQELGNQEGEAEYRHAVGWVLQAQGQYEKAEAYINETIEIAKKIGDFQRVILAMVTLGKAALGAGNIERANAIVVQAYEISNLSEVQYLPSGLVALKGRLAMESGNWAEAERLLKESVELAEFNPGGSPSMSSRRLDLGRIALAQGRLHDAKKYFQLALENSELFQREDTIAHSTFGLAKVWLREGEQIHAEEMALNAREQFHRLGMRKEFDEVESFLTLTERLTEDENAL